MENKQQKLGSEFEEKVRNYFLINNYFVIRGVIVKDGTADITDLDIWGYRNLGLYSYERIFADCKNKKRPKMAERLLWTIGIKHSIGVEKAFLAVNTARYQFQEFAVKNNVVILDNDTLKDTPDFARKSDEELIDLFNKNDLLGTPSKDSFDKLKNLAVGKIEIKNINNSIYIIKDNIEKHIENPSEATIRLLLFSIAIFYLLLDMLFMKYHNISSEYSISKIVDGIKYGEDSSRIKSLSLMLSKITGENVQTIYNTLIEEGNKNIDILKDSIIKNGNYFKHSKSFENATYNIDLNINTEMKAIILIFCDYFNINRSKISL